MFSRDWSKPDQQPHEEEITTAKIPLGEATRAGLPRYDVMRCFNCTGR
jgi:hypothetical protein